MEAKDFYLGPMPLPEVPPRSSQITVLLKAWGDGDAAALNRLTPLVYAELHRMARRYMRKERAGNTIQTTGLVNEAYLRRRASRLSG